MYVDPTWLPVVTAGVRWVKETFTSRKQMNLKIDDLRRQVELLSFGNQVLLARQAEIMAAVFAQLRSDGLVVIHVNGNVAELKSSVHAVSGARQIVPMLEMPVQPNALESSSLFEGVDEEIASARSSAKPGRGR